MRLFFIFLLSSLSLLAEGVKFELLPVERQIEAGSSFELAAEFKIPEGEYIYASEGSDIGLPTGAMFSCRAQTVFDGASVAVPLLLPVQENISKSEQKPAKETSLCILDIFICVPCQSSFSSPKYCFPSFQKIAYRTPAFSSACMALMRSLSVCISSSALPFQS